MMNATQEILSIFEQVAAVPRASMHEEKIGRWLLDWAANRNLSAEKDKDGNVIIRVPASIGYEKAPTIILQGHMDMVCEKTPDSPHDFTKDPIHCIVDGDWLRADRTTLGADDGIAIATALAIVDSPEVKHPPLELLFTVQEEAGLGGAGNVSKEWLKGRLLVNLDSEVEGVFTVGCAGGRGVKIYLPLSFEPVANGQAVDLKVGGLHGGHSGIDINMHFASANQVMARLLGEIHGKVSFRIADVRGGTASNAISREAHVTLALQSDDIPQLKEVVDAFQRTLKDEYATTEPSIAINVKPAQANRAMSESDTEKEIALLQALPHGVDGMSPSVEGLVETSNNLAIINIQGDELYILSSQRSMVMSRLDEIVRRVAAVGQLAGARVEVGEGYLPWQPNLNSPLLARSRAIYETLFGTPARVEAIHAGVECGIFERIYGDMDMISLGATVVNPHSPNERLYIPSVVKIWDFLVELLRSYKPD